MVRSLPERGGSLLEYLRRKLRVLIRGTDAKQGLTQGLMEGHPGSLRDDLLEEGAHRRTVRRVGLQKHLESPRALRDRQRRSELVELPASHRTPAPQGLRQGLIQGLRIELHLQLLQLSHHLREPLR